MRNYKNITFVALGLAMLLGACKKYEQFPVDKILIDEVFDKRDSAGTKAQMYLYTIYGVLKNGHNGVNSNYIDAASDDAITSTPATEVERWATDGYDAFTFPTSSGSDNLWSSDRNYYQGIRRCNEFINNIDVVPVKSTYNGISQKYLWRNEARFLRAFFYFEMVKRFGGVPLIGNKVFQLGDNLDIPRSSFADCIDYIVTECDAIKDTLVVGPSSPGDVHRITKGAALALKAEALLFAASPLYNGGNIAANNPLTGYVGGTETRRWALAAEAAREVISLPYYNTVTPISDVFLKSQNAEVIFARVNERNANNDENNGPIGFITGTALGLTSPTQELVNAFPMRNGRAITAAGSGYNPQDPYSNRDPRLALTVFYNGHRWLKGTVATFNGGASRPNSGGLQTRTGYYLRKFLGNFEESDKFEDHYTDWVIFRYSGMLLNFLEASNEAGGRTDSIYNGLRKLRLAAGIEQGNDANNAFGIPTTSDRDVLRELIRNERRITLAFEGKRFFDLRRWKTAETIMNQPRRGINIVNNGGVLTFSEVDVLQTRFSTKMYFYPVPDGEMRKNSAIGKANQNPGW